MSLSSFLRRLGVRTVDRVVGLTSGTTPIPALDSASRAWGLVVVVGLVAVLGSGWLVYHTITSATKLRVSSAATNPAAAKELEKLKGQDTDSDGLSDYDELFAYKSSPYLKSSAGDGITDGDKVKRGLDPNCPVGQACQSFHLLTSPVDATGQLTPDFLRQALQAAGVPKSTLDTTDDATLLKIYRQVVSQQPAANTNGATNTSTNNSNAGVNTNQAGSASAMEQLQNLSAGDIRRLLIQNGIDQTTLDRVDDTTLRQIFQQAIQSAQ